MLKYSKIRNVNNPSLAHPGHDAGIDFFVPVFDKSFICRLTECNNLHLKLMLDNSRYFQIVLLINLGCKLNLIFVYNTVLDDCYITIPAGGRVLIPAGIKVNVPQGKALIAFNKSGVAAKKGLIAGSCVVDHGYQGEVHLSLINTTNHAVNIYLNLKILQFILLSVLNLSISEVSLDLLYLTESNRGAGGFGSTDTQK